MGKTDAWVWRGPKGIGRSRRVENRMTDSPPIKSAATIILVRDAQTQPKLLMGQRGAKAAFMPNKYVFPGGAVDPADAQIKLATPLNDICSRRLGPDAEQFVSAAIRELWEESGLRLAVDGTMGPAPPSDWRAFTAGNYAPSARDLRYVFRAITPAGRPRRFDARFFLAPAEAIISDLDDFSAASDELSHLHWVDLAEARNLDLPFITEVVLAEVLGLLADNAPPESVPFFDNSTDTSRFSRVF